MSDKIIDPVSKVIDTTQKLGGFIANVLKEPLNESIGMLTDKIAYKRWEHTHKLIDKYESFVSQRKNQEKTVAAPPKILFQILESSSLEDEETLQNLWARLLASATHADTKSNIRNAFVDIIRQLDVIDVHILKFIYDSYASSIEAEYVPPNFLPRNHALPREKIINKLNISRHDYEASVDNLMRTRCVISQVIDSSVDLAPVKSKKSKTEVMKLQFSRSMQYKSISLTTLGLLFVKSCMTDESSK